MHFPQEPGSSSPHEDDMKIWRVPCPYDYHGLAEFLVLAKTAEEALKKVALFLGGEEYTPKGCQKALGDPQLFTQEVYFNWGCDC